MAAVRLVRLRPVAIHLVRMNTDTAPAAKNRAIAKAVTTKRMELCGCNSSFLWCYVPMACDRELKEAGLGRSDSHKNCPLHQHK